MKTKKIAKKCKIKSSELKDFTVHNSYVKYITNGEIVTDENDETVISISGIVIEGFLSNDLLFISSIVSGEYIDFATWEELKDKILDNSNGGITLFVEWDDGKQGSLYVNNGTMISCTGCVNDRLNTDKPVPNTNLLKIPDFNHIIFHTEDYIENIDHYSYNTNFEATLKQVVLEAVYGENIFKWINEQDG